MGASISENGMYHYNYKQSCVITIQICQKVTMEVGELTHANVKTENKLIAFFCRNNSIIIRPKVSVDENI